MWGNHPEWKPVLDRLIAAFEKTHPGIEVELSYKPGPQYTAALNTALAGGAAPDVIGWIEGDAIRVGAKAKQIIPLDGKIPLGRLIPAARAQVAFNGHVYGSPLAAYTVGIFYQRPIFKKYGLKPPTSWPQLLAVTKKLKDEGVTPWSMPAKDMIIPYFFYIMAASSILGQDGYRGLRRGTRKVTEKQVVRAAQLMIDLQEYYNDGFQAVSYAEGKALFAQGRTAMLIGGSADYTGYKQVNPKVDVGVFGFPSPSGNRHVTVTGMELLYTVNAESSHKPEATTLVNWLSSKGAQQVVANELARPIAVGVVPSRSNRVGREMVLAGAPDIPVWYSQPETGGTFGAVTSAGGIFTGDLDAAGFAKKVQASVTPNPKA
jgi:raffinose/stachyose/melibiose transport system substrate-binding protein